MTLSKHVRPNPIFKSQLLDFLKFIRRPDFRRGLHRGTGAGWFKDWQATLTLKHMLAFALVLWLINLFVLAPIAMNISESVGATHRLRFSLALIPLSVLWAPLVEEMLFRFSLRKPSLMVWVVPLMLFVWRNEPCWWSLLVLVLVLWLIMVWYPKQQWTQMRFSLPFKWRRLYRKYFFWVLHLSVLIFALLHVLNFDTKSANNIITWWQYLFLVLPQWLTGTVLAWLRVRYGIANAIMLHAIYNGGPMLLLLLGQQFFA